MADKVDRDAHGPKFVSKRTANAKLRGRPRDTTALPRDTKPDDKLQTIDLVRFFVAKSRPRGTQAWAGRVAEEETQARQPDVDNLKLQLTEKDMKRGWNIVSEKKARIRKFLERRGLK